MARERQKIMKYFDEYKVGDTQETRARTMTEADIVNFAGLSGDFYPLHMDAEYAKKTIFGKRIAHGFLVLSIASGLFPLYEIPIVAGWTNFALPRPRLSVTPYTAS